MAADRLAAALGAHCLASAASLDSLLVQLQAEERAALERQRAVLTAFDRLDASLSQLAQSQRADRGPAAAVDPSPPGAGPGCGVPAPLPPDGDDR